MNRRNFLSSILKAGIGAAILPSAVTYARKWIKTETLFIPQWTQEEIELYRTYPQYLAKQQVESKIDWYIWNKLVYEAKWKSNLGSVIR